MKTISHAVLTALLMALISVGSASAQQAENGSQSENAKNAKTGGSGNSSASKLPSDHDIANAKAEGLVWANQRSRVYYRDGDSYGKTAHGKFMTENDAKKAGFRQVKDSKTSAKSTKKAGDQSGIDSTIGTHASTPAKP